MDRWGSWRSRSLTSRVGARRAGVTALALFVVTAALAVLLAVLFHLAWPPVLVSVVGTVPALYLAWLAVPGALGQKKPTYCRRVAQRRAAAALPPALTRARVPAPGCDPRRRPGAAGAAGVPLSWRTRASSARATARSRSAHLRIFPQFSRMI